MQRLYLYEWIPEDLQGDTLQRLLLPRGKCWQWHSVCPALQEPNPLASLAMLLWSYPTTVFLDFLGGWGAAPAAYVSSQARGPIRTAAAVLHHSHSHARSELHLQPTPQLMEASYP